MHVPKNGPNGGKKILEKVTAVADVAKFGQLSPYELLTGMRGRLPRLYAGEDE